jgi:hypothetical protein
MHAVNESLNHPCPVLEPPKRPTPAFYSTRLAFLEACCQASVIGNIALAVALCAVLIWTYNVYRASLMREVHFFAVDSAGGLLPVIRTP